MSAATEFAPAVVIPERAYAPRSPERLASVTILHAPAPATAPLRLTRRGVAVLAGAVAVLAASLLMLAWLSAPRAAGAAGPRTVGDRVTVQAGDTLWSIAARVAPATDPRAEVAVLQRVNRLAGTALLPGQVLRTR